MAPTSWEIKGSVKNLGQEELKVPGMRKELCKC